MASTTYSAQNQGTDWSPLYTSAAPYDTTDPLSLLQLIGEVGLTPLVAIDTNQDGAVGSVDNLYMIDYINVCINGLLAYQFGPPLPNTVPQSRTGNGVSDYVIAGLNLAGATSLQFEVQYGNFLHVPPAQGPEVQDYGDNNDGKELFFLVNSGASQVPESASMMLVGTGLIGLAAAARRRMSRKK